MIDKYNVVVLILCSYFGVNECELGKVMNKKQNLYLTILLLDNFDCLNIDVLMKCRLDSFSSKKIRSKLEKAQEKVLINIDFRKEYFELEDIIEKKLKKA